MLKCILYPTYNYAVILDAQWLRNQLQVSCLKHRDCSFSEIFLKFLLIVLDELLSISDLPFYSGSCK